MSVPAYGQGPYSDMDRAGLDGAHRVSWMTDGPRRLTLLGRAGYGFISEAGDEGGSHQRIQGSFGAAFRAHRLLAFALGATGRLDFHPDDELGSDRSGFGKPWLVARVGGSLGDFSLGGEVRWELFGGDAPAFDIGASRLALRLLAAYELGALRLALNAGFRIDGSADIVRSEQNYRRGDEVSLAANDWNALLFGLAANYSFGSGSLYLEATLEPFIGSDAPSFGQSAIRVGAGARYDIGAVTLSGGAELALQERTVVNLDAVREVEPLLRIFVGLAYTFDFDYDPSAEGGEGLDGEDREGDDDEDPLNENVIFEGLVSGADGGLGGATLTLVNAEGEVVATTQADDSGTYRFELPAGTEVDGLTLRASGEGYEDFEAPAASGTAVAMVAVTPEGALRGLVRDFRGRSLEATVRVGEATAQTDADGVFELNLEAGEHEVTIVSDGFQTQTRTVTVDEGGVTVMNVDMRRGRR
ncbi:MAG: carboxypeptidase-like regulatory domain-containing protein [Myxococcota bacterium]